MEDYDEVIARQPGGALTKAERQRTRYGAKIDAQRHAFRQALGRYAGYATTIGGIAGAIATIIKLWHGGS